MKHRRHLAGAIRTEKRLAGGLNKHAAAALQGRIVPAKTLSEVRCESDLHLTSVTTWDKPTSSIKTNSAGDLGTVYLRQLEQSGAGKYHMLRLMVAACHRQVQRSTP